MTFRKSEVICPSGYFVALPHADRCCGIAFLFVGDKGHERDALPSGDAWQHLVDERLEMIRPLMLGPPGFVSVQFEYEERLRVCR